MKRGNVGRTARRNDIWRDGLIDWPGCFANELLARQRPDGSWTNRFTDAKEDDPLIATPWAAAALAIGRAMTAGQPYMPGDRCRR